VRRSVSETIVDPLAVLVRYAIAPAWAAWERSDYLRVYRKLRATQYDTPEVTRDRQLQRLRGIVQHAHRTSEFWRERLHCCGLEPDSIRSFESYRRLPVLTKQDLRQHADDMRSRDYANAAVVEKKTSGSTGEAVRVVVDVAAQQFKRGATVRSDEWSGWKRGQRVACVWGNPEYLARGWRGHLRNALLDRAQYLDTLKMDVDAMRIFAERLRRKPPALLFGHAHSLFLFAEYLRQSGGAGFTPRGIISTAMVLHPWQRRTIEAVFGCPVTNRYGCEEVSLIACECEMHEGLHINADGVYVEILSSDGTPAAVGERGSVVVTDLQNRAMPLLRYKVGDTAIPTNRVCKCGRGLPLLESLEGREADYVTTGSGEMISGISLTENFAMLVPGIAQLQIVQESVDQFLLRIVRGDEFGERSLAQIAGLVRERFGAGARHALEFVDRIPQEPSGKYRFCISKVPNPFIVGQPLDV
jgi:phenylacetate-CoA ligase